MPPDIEPVFMLPPVLMLPLVLMLPFVLVLPEVPVALPFEAAVELSIVPVATGPVPALPEVAEVPGGVDVPGVDASWARTPAVEAASMAATAEAIAQLWVIFRVCIF
jgi:hypothetical protein